MAGRDFTLRVLLEWRKVGDVRGEKWGTFVQNVHYFSKSGC